MADKLSIFVISYNRAALLDACLRAASFADELVVVDKSSTDESVAVARSLATRVAVVPWTPTVEETRAYAVTLGAHEWILCLDDDEILSPETAAWWRSGPPPDADIVTIPLRHYIMGVHDERAYYWPETHARLFRRGAMAFSRTVHGGIVPKSDRVAPAPAGVCIHHLSHPDAASWVERANRYTSRPDRVRVAAGGTDLIRFAHDRIDFWAGRSADQSGDGYPAAAALLRAVYDMIDRVKMWEEARGLDGATLFREHAAALVPATVPRSAAAVPVTAPEEGDVRLRAAEAEVEALTWRARTAEARMAAALADQASARAAADAARRERDLIAGSARRFLRAYWPALRRAVRTRLVRATRQTAAAGD
jgi:hypothetical protein